MWVFFLLLPFSFRTNLVWAYLGNSGRFSLLSLIVLPVPRERKVTQATVSALLYIAGPDSSLYLILCRFLFRLVPLKNFLSYPHWSLSSGISKQGLCWYFQQNPGNFFFCQPCLNIDVMLISWALFFSFIWIRLKKDQELGGTRSMPLEKTGLVLLRLSRPLSGSFR